MILVFKCDDCGAGFRRYAGSLEPAPLRGVVCPDCGGKRTARDHRHERRANASRRFEPFFSESMGCFHDHERIPGETYDRENNVLVESEQHRRRLMKQLKLADRRDWKPVNRKATTRSKTAATPRTRRKAS